MENEVFIDRIRIHINFYDTVHLICANVQMF